MTIVAERQEQRWTARVKLAVLQVIDEGLLTPHEAEQRYGISPEELAEWRRFYAAAGTEGLRVRYQKRKRLWR
jgi:hypothetical protein